MRPTLLVVPLMLVACSSGPGEWIGRPPGDYNVPASSAEPAGQGGSRSVQEHESAIVGKAGGKVTFGHGSEVAIPAGALAEDITIRVTVETDAPAPTDGAPVGPTVLLGPEGQAFDEPVTVTLEIDPTKLDRGETLSDVLIYTSPKSNPSFTPLETMVVDGSHVSVKTPHFSYFVPVHGALRPGEYVSTAADVGQSAYIGDWRDSGGYVLGYFVPGSRIYAKYVTAHSVYGLIPNGGYGGWDNGHHCGWVPIGNGVHVRGSGSYSSVAATCPAWDNDFSLDHGSGWSDGPGEGKHKDKSLFREGSWVESNGAVQSAVVLPTCSDFTVYANYEPLTHTFSDPDGKEEAYRGTIMNLADKSDPCHAPSSPSGWTRYVSTTGVTAETGYCGFGTRFVSADGYAVEIKDTHRSGKSFTAFGFMHADCIAGAQVGNPAGTWPPKKPSCGTLQPGHSLHSTDEIVSCDRNYWLILGAQGILSEVEKEVGVLWDVKGRAGDHLDMQADGNLVLYSGKNPIWASMTNGYPGAYLSLQDDGNLVIYYGATAVWSRH